MKPTTYFDKAKKIDRVARWFITAGGILIILAVTAILLLILSVSLPLFEKPWAKEAVHFSLPTENIPVALGVDSYLQRAYLLDKKGQINILSLPEKKILSRISLAPKKKSQILFTEQNGPESYTLLWNSGYCSLLKVSFQAKFQKDGKKYFQATPKVLHFPLPKGMEKAQMAFIRREEEGYRFFFFSEKGIHFYFLKEKGNWSQGQSLPIPPNSKITTLCIDSKGDFLYGGTQEGTLLRWDLRRNSPSLLDQIQLQKEAAPITSLSMIFGDVSLAVGDQKGRIYTTFPVQKKGEPSKHLALIHTLPPLKSAITLLR
ncbi:MAG: hypothetical protein D6785_12580, partial [Planctomycetota bacterium]